jgi:hypothetical protein
MFYCNFLKKYFSKYVLFRKRKTNTIMWHVHLKGEADNKSKGMITKKKHKSNTPCPHIDH